MKYNCQKLSTETLKGEKWKDLPGLEMYFMISSYGRIKRLAYQQIYSDGRIFNRNQKIIKPIVMQFHNDKVGDDIYFLRNCVVMSGKKHYLSIARLVYYCFVRKFDLTNENTVILSVDGNGLNIRPSNLYLATKQQKQQRIYDKGRTISPFYISAYRAMGTQPAREVNSVPVKKLNNKGKIMKSYKSLTEASKEANISIGQICNVAKGREKSAGGYKWEYIK